MADAVISAGGDVTALTFSSDGGLIGGIVDQSFRWWDVASGSVRKSLSIKLDKGFPISSKLSLPLAAIAGTERTIQLWNIETGKVTHRFSGQKSLPYPTALSADGTLLASADGQDVRVWHLVSFKQRFVRAGGIGGSVVLAFSPRADLMVSADADTNLIVWDAYSGIRVRTLEELSLATFAVAFSPDGRYLATGGADRVAYLWEIASWKIVWRLTGQPQAIGNIVFSPDGRYLATGGLDADASANPANALVWDLQSGSLLQSIATSRYVDSITFSPNSKLLCLADMTKTIKIFEIVE